MNRPSRTDDDLRHPTWNQSPPFLAPDLTTRQDLNGIANAREHRSRRSSAANASGFLSTGKHASDLVLCQLDDGDSCLPPAASAMSGRLLPRKFQVAPPRPRPPPPGLVGSLVRSAETSAPPPPHPGPLIAPKTVLGGEGQARLSRRLPVRPPSGWVGWFASVVVMAALINVVGGRLLSIPALLAGLHAVKPSPSAGLRRLAKRQDACQGQVAEPDEYDMPLHVGALIIILAVSTLACAIPLLATKFPVLRIPEPFFFAVRHFGTGVLLATAFVHLLPTAFISLGNPCLSNFWTTDYPAMPGAIAMVGIFFVTVIEMVFSPARSFIPRSAGQGKGKDKDKGSGSGSGMGAGGKDPGSETQVGRPSMAGGRCSQAGVAAAITRPMAARRESIELAPLRDAAHVGGPSRRRSKEVLEVESQRAELTPEQQHKKSILQCMLLEVGILFHSVFIGMALSVAVGGDFVVLLIAIAFHRTSHPVSHHTASRTDGPVMQKPLKDSPSARASLRSPGPRRRCSPG